MAESDYVEIHENRVLEVIHRGPVGPPGPQGTPGPVGSTYVHSQALAQLVWTVSHNLNMFPNVTSVDSSDREIIGALTYVDANTLTLTFTSPESGKAYLS